MTFQKLFYDADADERDTLMVAFNAGYRSRDAEVDAMTLRAHIQADELKHCKQQINELKNEVSELEAVVSWRDSHIWNLEERLESEDV